MNSTAAPTPTAAPQSTRFAIFVGIVLLVLAVIAYLPVFKADFIRWDDTDYVTKNRLLDNASGLAKLWNPFEKIEQYYPLVFTTLWLEHHLWDNQPLGYHVVNLALHLVNILLVLQLFRRLGASDWAAAIAAAVFALHPAQVASVAWVSQLKNTLSGFFYLSAFLLYLHHRRRASSVTYLACLAAFFAALLSKTQTATFPISVALADWMLQKAGRLRPVSRSALLARAVPFLLLGLIASAVTASVEKRNGPAIVPSTPAQRPLIAANAGWFYVASFVVPIYRVPMYPHWEVSPSDPKWWLAIIAWPVALWFWWRARRSLTGLTHWGIAHFLIALVPVVGLVPFNYQQFSMVADHYFYLPVIGGGLALAELAIQLTATTSSSWRAVRSTAAVSLLAATIAFTHSETRYWRGTETYWRRTLERNPDCFPANYNLGNFYREQFRWAEALPLYRRAATVRPAHSLSFGNYIDALNAVEGPQAVIRACDERIASNPNFFRAYLERGKSLERVGQPRDAMSDYFAVLRLTRQGTPSYIEARSHLELIKRKASGG